MEDNKNEINKKIAGKVNELISIVSTDKIKDRYTLFPIKDKVSFKFYKMQETQLWNANELNFGKDKEQYDKLDVDEKRIIDIVLIFFSAADGIICKNLSFRFLLEAETIEESSFYTVQQYIEMVHAESYSLMINTLIRDQSKRIELFESVDSLECVKAKNLWMESYICSDLSKQHRLIAFACAEGIFFTSSFLFIFWFRKKGVLQNLITANEMIARDEALHRNFACEKYKEMGNRLEDEEVYNIVKDAVRIELLYVKEILPNNNLDINYENVSKFVMHIADDLLTTLGYKKLWNISHEEIPTWMDSGMDIKQNFYEGDVTNYKTSTLKNALNWEERLKNKSNACYTNPSEVEF